MSSEEKKGKLAGKSLVLTMVFGVLVACALGVAIFYFIQYQKTQAMLRDPQQSTAEKSQMLVEDVGKIMELPTNEKPQIATVSDVNKLKQQSFFAQAKNGDVVLIYTEAKKAILYDPAAKKIVEVGPINFADAKTPPANSSVTPTELRVSLYNGTKVTGLSSTTEKTLTAKLPNVTVVAKSNAAKATYTKTTVVDLTGRNAAGAAQIAQALGGEVGSLPAGEVKPKIADIVVILGRE